MSSIIVELPQRLVIHAGLFVRRVFSTAIGKRYMASRCHAYSAGPVGWHVLAELAGAVLHRHEGIVIMNACELSLRRRVAMTACAVLPTLGIVG